MSDPTAGGRPARRSESTEGSKIAKATCWGLFLLSTDHFEMDGSPSKRVLTETTLDSRSLVDGSTRNDGVSEELRALLRNRAARVRKSVMEGYTLDRTAPPQDAHTHTCEGVAEPAQIFQSARDINDQVLRHWTPSPFSSPKKRSRNDYEVEDALEEENEEGMQIDSVEAVPPDAAKDISQRPTKPLRRALFSATDIASKLSSSQNQTLCADRGGSHSENPFLE